MKMEQQAPWWACFTACCGYEWKNAGVVSEMLGVYSSEVAKKVVGELPALYGRKPTDVEDHSKNWKKGKLQGRKSGGLKDEDASHEERI